MVTKKTVRIIEKITFSILLLITILGCCKNPPIRFDAIYFDMDGTILNSRNIILKETKDAINQYLRCGGKVGIATGRTLEQVEKYIKQINPNLPIVLFNGAIMITPVTKEIIYQKSLKESVIQPVIDNLYNEKGVIGIIVQGRKQTIIAKDSNNLKYFLKEFNINWTSISAEGVLKGNEKPIKIMIIVENINPEVLKRKLEKSVEGELKILVTSSQTVEIVDSGVSKAIPIEIALKKSKIEKSNVLTFGDSGNDVEMLSEIGFGFAMDNCRSGACRAAKIKIGNNDTPSIANIIKGLAIRPECK